MDGNLHVLRFCFSSCRISYHQCYFCQFVFNQTPKHPSRDKDPYSKFKMVITFLATFYLTKNLKAISPRLICFVMILVPFLILAVHMHRAGVCETGRERGNALCEEMPRKRPGAGESWTPLFSLHLLALYLLTALMTWMPGNEQHGQESL